MAQKSQEPRKEDRDEDEVEDKIRRTRKKIIEGKHQGQNEDMEDCEWVSGLQDNYQYKHHDKYKDKEKEEEEDPYFIFVTGTTGAARVKISVRCKFLPDWTPKTTYLTLLGVNFRYFQV